MVPLTYVKFPTSINAEKLFELPGIHWFCPSCDKKRSEYTTDQYTHTGLGEIEERIKEINANVTLKFEQLKKEIQEVVLNTAHESAKKYSDALKTNLEINTSSIGTHLKSIMNNNNAVLESIKSKSEQIAQAAEKIDAL